MKNTLYKFQLLSSLGFNRNVEKFSRMVKDTTLKFLKCSSSYSVNKININKHFPIFTRKKTLKALFSEFFSADQLPYGQDDRNYVSRIIDESLFVGREKRVRCGCICN